MAGCGLNSYDSGSGLVTGLATFAQNSMKKCYLLYIQYVMWWPVGLCREIVLAWVEHGLSYGGTSDRQAFWWSELRQHSLRPEGHDETNQLLSKCTRKIPTSSKYKSLPSFLWAHIVHTSLWPLSFVLFVDPLQQYWSGLKHDPSHGRFGYLKSWKQKAWSGSLNPIHSTRLLTQN
jgi:hypothetical protein